MGTCCILLPARWLNERLMAASLEEESWEAVGMHLFIDLSFQFVSVVADARSSRLFFLIFLSLSRCSETDALLSLFCDLSENFPASYNNFSSSPYSIIWTLLCFLNLSWWAKSLCSLTGDSNSREFCWPISLAWAILLLLEVILACD